jgi:hypothetical protein
VKKTGVLKASKWGTDNLTMTPTLDEHTFDFKTLGQKLQSCAELASTDHPSVHRPRLKPCSEA